MAVFGTGSSDESVAMRLSIATTTKISGVIEISSFDTRGQSDNS